MAQAARLKLVPRPSALPASVDDVHAGLRAFFRIMDTWQVDSNSAIVLLGSPPRSTYFNWKKGQGREFSLDLKTRLSYILGIFRALEIIYQDPQNADRWVNQPNLALGGQSALERMMAGQITDLAAVRDYLDSVRGGW